MPGKATAKIAVPFQFLLGRLETEILRQQRIRDSGFQFLLGRLETRMDAESYRVLKGFNSS